MVVRGEALEVMAEPPVLIKDLEPEVEEVEEGGLAGFSLKAKVIPGSVPTACRLPPSGQLPPLYLLPKPSTAFSQQEPACLPPRRCYVSRPTWPATILTGQAAATLHLVLWEVAS